MPGAAAAGGGRRSFGIARNLTKKMDGWATLMRLGIVNLLALTVAPTPPQLATAT